MNLLSKILLIVLVLSFVPATSFLSFSSKAQTAAPVTNFSATISNVATVNYTIALKASASFVSNSSCSTGSALHYSLSNIGTRNFTEDNGFVVESSSGGGTNDLYFEPGVNSGYTVSGYQCTDLPIHSGATYYVNTWGVLNGAKIHTAIMMYFHFVANGRVTTASTYPRVALNWKQSLQEGSPTVWKYQMTNDGTKPFQVYGYISWDGGTHYWQSPDAIVKPGTTQYFTANNKFHIKCGTGVDTSFVGQWGSGGILGNGEIDLYFFVNSINVRCA